MIKLIVDTSVWIDFFKDHLSSSLRSYFLSSLDNQLLVITDIVEHEILMGALTKRQYQELKELLSPLEKLRISNEELPQFTQFAWDLYRKRLKGSYTDLTIAYLSQAYHFPILSFDRYFYRLAEQGMIKVITS